MSELAYRLATGVAFVEGEGDELVVYAARLPEGPPVILRDVSAVIWGEACGGGTVADIVTGTAERVGLGPDAIRSDVIAFLDELVSLGLIETSQDSSRS